MGRAVLKQIREKGVRGVRTGLVKDRNEKAVMDDLDRMGLIKTDGDMALSKEIYERIKSDIAGLKSNGNLGPSELGNKLGIQRKVVFTVLSWMEEEKDES